MIEVCIRRSPQLSPTELLHRLAAETQERSDAVKFIFKSMDTDSDGFLSGSEMCRFAELCGFDDEWQVEYEVRPSPHLISCPLSGPVDTLTLSRSLSLSLPLPPLVLECWKESEAVPVRFFVLLNRQWLLKTHWCKVSSRKGLVKASTSHFHLHVP